MSRPTISRTHHKPKAEGLPTGHTTSPVLRLAGGRSTDEGLAVDVVSGSELPVLWCEVCPRHSLELRCYAVVVKEGELLSLRCMVLSISEVSGN